MTKNDTTETTMFQTLLQKLVNDKQLDVQQMARLTGIDPTTFYKWISGDRQPSLGTFMRFFRAAPSDVQQALLNLMTLETQWHCFYTPNDFELDVNGDGRVSAADATQAMAAAVIGCGRQISETGTALSDGKLSDHERIKLDNIGRQTINQILTSLAVVAHIFRKQCPKRKAHSLHAGGAA